MSAGQIKRRVPRIALTRTEAAEALGMSVDHFDKHVKDDVRIVYSGTLTLYPVAELQRWADENSAPTGRRKRAS